MLGAYTATLGYGKKNKTLGNSVPQTPCPRREQGLQLNCKPAIKGFGVERLSRGASLFALDSRGGYRNT